MVSPLDAYQWAERYAALGVSVLPVPPGTKSAPLGFEWGQYRGRHADASERYYWYQDQGCDVAVIGGAISGNLAVLDFDTPDGYDALAALYPAIAELPRVRTGSGKVHVWLRTQEPTRTYVTNAPNGGRLEVRGEGVLTVAPPSLHPSGGHYRWEVEPNGIPIIELASLGLPHKPLIESAPEAPLIEGSELPAATKAELAAILQPAWATGQRHNLALALAGWLAYHNVPEPDALDLVFRLRQGAGESRDEVNAIAAVQDTYRKARAGIAVAGWSVLTDARARLVTPDQESRLHDLLRYRDPVVSFTARPRPANRPWLIDVADLLGEPDEEEVWLVNHWLTLPMVGLVVGPPKTFKSLLIQELAVAVATGTPFLGVYAVPAAESVVYVQEESSRRALRKRFRGILEGRAMDVDDVRERLYTITNERFRLDNIEHVNRLVIEGIEATGAKLVIFDPLRELHDKDENSAQEMREILGHLKELRDQAGVSVLVVHHNNKNPDVRNPAEAIRGSTSIWGAMDGGWFLQDVNKDDGAKRISVILKEGGQTAPVLYRPVFAGGEIAFETKDEEAVKSGRAPKTGDDDLLAYFATNADWFTASTLAERYNYSPAGMRTRLGALVRRGALQAGKRGKELWFAWPDVSRDLLF